MQHDEAINRHLGRQVARKSHLLGDFMVEFMGGLLPGLLFLAALFLVFFPPVCTLMLALSGGELNPGVSIFDICATMMNYLNESQYMMWVMVFMLGLALAYVLGNLFYRRTPKKPNVASFERITRGHPTTEELADFNVKLQVYYQENNVPDEQRQEATEGLYLQYNYACDKGKCEFPFLHMGKYLALRGHKHLLTLVKWDGDDNLRSKTFINMIKSRLQYYVPDKYRFLVRNEAHVRLATSAWYACVSLLTFSIVGLAIWLIAAGIGFYRLQLFFGSNAQSLGAWREGLKWALPAAVFPLSILAISWYCKITKEEFIHYQRVREVFNVLELAYTALNDFPRLLHIQNYRPEDVYNETQGTPGERRSIQRRRPQTEIAVKIDNKDATLVDIHELGMCIKTCNQLDIYSRSKTLHLDGKPVYCLPQFLWHQTKNGHSLHGIRFNYVGDIREKIGELAMS